MQWNEPRGNCLYEYICLYCHSTNETWSKCWKQVLDGSKYWTEAKYHNKEFGYSIQSIGGFSDNNKRGPGCYWGLYAQPNHCPELRLRVGVSFFIPPRNSTFRLRYENSWQSIKVIYKLEYKWPFCQKSSSPKEVVVTVAVNSTVLEVMEEAVNSIDGDNFRYQISYHTDQSSYSIDELNGEKLNKLNGCHWCLLIGFPDGDVKPLSMANLTTYSFLDNGYTIIWHYKKYCSINLVS